MVVKWASLPLGLILYWVIFLLHGDTQTSAPSPGEQTPSPSPPSSHTWSLSRLSNSRSPSSLGPPPCSHCLHLVVVVLERLAQTCPLLHEVLAALVCADNKGGRGASELHHCIHKWEGMQWDGLLFWCGLCGGACGEHPRLPWHA